MALGLSKLLTSTAAALDRRFGWDKLPRPLGVLTLVGLRTRLREKNLYDTGAGGATAAPSERPAQHPHVRRQLHRPGAAGDGDDRRPLRPQRPGRPHLSRSRCRSCSSRTRGSSAASCSRATSSSRPRSSTSSPEPGSSSRCTTGSATARTCRRSRSSSSWPTTTPGPTGRCEIERTRSDPAPDAKGGPPTYVTADSHWWDGSQIYGSEPALAAALRSNEGGKLRLDPDGQLPRDLEQHVDLTGVAGNFWLGLALLHTLFTHEHNAICDRLRSEYPRWSDDELYDRARLINAALMAKIHTVEWTPAIIAHPTTKYAMRANWYGILGKRLGKRSSNEVLGGIPGSPTDHHGVPYSLTEEFVAVYRMHPLLPDDFTFRSIETDEVLQERTFRELGALDTRARLDEVGFVNSLLLARDRPPGRDHAAQLPALPAGVPEAGRDGGRPGGDRRAAHPRARRAALQRVPAPLPPEAGGDVRGADRQPGVGEGAASGSTATSSAST